MRGIGDKPFIDFLGVEQSNIHSLDRLQDRLNCSAIKCDLYLISIATSTTSDLLSNL